MPRETSVLWELGIVALVFAIVNIVSQIYQHPVSANDGKGWDGLHYHAMAEQMAKGQRLHEEAPFVYRVGTPYLAALVAADNLLSGFKLVNAVANALAVCLLMVWLRLFLKDWRLRLVLTLVFVTHWLNPVRFIYFYPVYTDPWQFVFLVAGLVAIRLVQDRPSGLRIALVALVTSMGSMFREVVLLVPLALLFSGNPLLPQKNLSEAFFELSSLRVRRVWSMPPLRFGIPLALGIAGMVLMWTFITPTNDYSFLKSAGRTIYEKPLPRYIHAWFVAFGPLLAVVLYDWRSALSFLKEHQALAVYLVGIAFLAYVGGNDTERYLHWGIPVVYLLMGGALERHWLLLRSRALAGILIACQLIWERAFWTVPDPSAVRPFCWVFLTADCYLYLWSDFIPSVFSLVMLLQFGGLTVVVLLWMNHRAKTVAGYSTPEVR